MSTGTWIPYGLTFEKIFGGGLDLHGNTDLYLMFTSSTHTPNRDTHDFEADLTNVVSGTNLSASGVALSGATIAFDAGSDTISFDLADVSEDDVTATGIRNLHIVDKTSGNSATNLLVAYCTLDGDLSPSAGTLAVTFDADGVFTVDLNPS